MVSNLINQSKSEGSAQHQEGQVNALKSQIKENAERVEALAV